MTLEYQKFLDSLSIPLDEWGSKQLDLKGTPKRVQKMWETELLSGYRPISELVAVFRTFEADEEMTTQDMVVVRDIPFVSVCGHHMLPFSGTAHIGYIPNKKYAGLSKLARALDHFARRLQTQERLTSQVADFLFFELEARGVHVVTQAEHMCMTIRGVQKPGTTTVLAALRGKCEEDHVKSEFHRLVSMK